jgi:hypothetical protein
VLSWGGNFAKILMKGVQTCYISISLASASDAPPLAEMSACLIVVRLLTPGYFIDSLEFAHHRAAEHKRLWLFLLV